MIQLILSGNIGKDAELTKNEKFCRFSLAATYNKKDTSGKWEKVTQWVNVTTSSGRMKFLKKGASVVVTANSFDLSAKENNCYISCFASDLEILKFAGDGEKQDSGLPF